MKKIISCALLIFTLCLISAETFTYTPNFPEIYTSREVALTDNYVADYSTYFSVWANPANAGITGDKFLLPFLSFDMYSDFKKSLPLVLSAFDATEDIINEYINQNDTAPLNMNVTGPLCIGAVKNNFFWGIFNNTYTSTDVKTVDEGIVTGGEQTVFTTGYAYPIKLPLKTVISLGLSAKGFIDIQGLSENQPAKGLIALSKLNFEEIPLFTTFGFGFDVGLTISLFDIFTVSASWNNFFAGAYTKKYDNLTDLKSFTKKYDTLATMPLEDNLILGAALKLPLENITKGLISKFNAYVNYSDFLLIFDKEVQIENYMDYLTFGTELELLNTICLRAGLNSEHLAFGVGLKMGVIKMDVGLYSKAWGMQKLDTKELGISFSFGTYK